MPTPVRSIGDIKPGDLFEDCAFHPCICIATGARDDEDGVEGISLVDGSGPRGCSATHCGLRRLTLEEAVHWKFHGPRDETLSPEKRWWENPKPT
jgi:hypothetical protein